MACTKLPKNKRHPCCKNNEVGKTHFFCFGGNKHKQKMSHKEDLADTEMDDATSSPRRSRRKKVTRALYHETDEPTGLDDQTLQIVYKLGETAWSDDELTQFYESYSIDKAHVHVATRSKEQIQALIDLHGGSAVLDTLTEKEFVPLHKQIVAKYDVPLSPSRKRKTPTRKRPDLFLNLETTPTSPNNTSSTTTSTSHISTPTSAKRKLKSLTDDEIVYKHHPRKQKFDLVLPMDAQIALQAVPPTPVTEERTKSLPAKLRGKAQVVTSGVIVSNSARVPVQVLNDDDEQTATATLPNVEQASQKLYKAIQISKMRQFCVCEWFYPSIDFFYYEKSEFLEFAKITLPELPINEFMKKRDWNYIRGKLGKPRRLSQAYLSEEKQKMHTFRQAVRLYYKLHIYKAEADSLDADDDSDATKRNLEFDMLSILDDYDIPAPLQPGEKVLIRSLDGNHIYSGTVLDTRHNYLAIDKKKKRKRSETVNHLSLFQEYNVQFDYDKSEKFVPDWCVMSMLKPGSISNGIERKTTLIEVRKKLQEHDALRTPPSKRSRAAPTTPAPPLREAEMSMAECINLLKKKDKMLTQLTVMNDEVKKLVCFQPVYSL